MSIKTKLPKPERKKDKWPLNISPIQDNQNLSCIPILFQIQKIKGDYNGKN